MSTDVDAILVRTGEIAGAKRPHGLGRWMARHYEALVNGFAGQTEKLDWDAFVRSLAEAGITGRDGKPYGAETARKAWARVNANNVVRRRAAAPASPAPPGLGPRLVPRVVAVRPGAIGPGSASSDVGDDEDVPVFRPARRAE